MSDFVRWVKDQDIAVITIDNPPVNALSPGVPEGIVAALEQVQNDRDLRAAVLIGAGKTFIAGADIKEFVKLTSGQHPGEIGILPHLLKIEDSTKPIVAAIHGNALGGGLEVAQACHYRVASVDARVGQPEVNLGIIPGAGGTQRLPRLVGVERAIEMCTAGKPVKATEAVQFGLIDQAVEGDLLRAAIAFARAVAANPIRKTRERSDKLGDAQQNAPIFAAARENARKKYRGMICQLLAIDAIEAATKLPFEKGCAEEARLFYQCLYSDQSKAQIHVFFAEREVSKIPDIPKETPVIPVHSVAVVGAGTMGGGIAMVCANAGLPVVVKDIDQQALDRGIATIQKNYAMSVKRGRFTQGYVDERMKLIRTTLHYEDFAGADMVIEAVFETMPLKKQVFAELDRVCKKGAILSSNTSTLNIDEIAATTSRPEAVIGMHFFSPANVMRLLEIVRGRRTAKDVIATCLQLAKKLGKVGVLVGNCRGFVGNRMFLPYIREAQFLVEEGAAPEAVDKALVDWGMAMGPLAVGDLGGLDVAYRIRKEYRHLEKPGARQPFLEDRLVEMGRLGQKTGAGWYRYDAERRASPDPEIPAMVRRWVAESGIPQRQISAEEIVEREIYSLVNEGARILEEGYALRAGDIDTIYVNGYGFPVYRGGPMWYADTVGLKEVYGRVRHFHERLGGLWEPARLLKELAESGGTFAHFQRVAAQASD
ncbi:MAG TPA: 3-hydroxyacyl-CoA dehydrogenase NAD-binding domain-containing protein [Candidatus Acidoferrales bacterium]|nr:3-hydroxyacyl-CoA dehydrogenase NAD-binding domain-containing protein [Candidatus Acidoferrales bacterium]